jgi:hypothetical protein
VFAGCNEVCVLAEQGKNAGKKKDVTEICRQEAVWGEGIIDSLVIFEGFRLTQTSISRQRVPPPDSTVSKFRARQSPFEAPTTMD